MERKNNLISIFITKKKKGEEQTKKTLETLNARRATLTLALLRPECVYNFNKLYIT